jgi:hypothetical protein
MRTLCTLCMLLCCVSIVVSCSGMHGVNASSRAAEFYDERDHYLSVIQESRPKTFEDIDRVLKWRDNQCILHQSAFDGGAKVFDYFTGEAIPVREGVYVIDSGIETSGGQRTIAFKDRDSAERFISENGTGTIVAYEALVGSEE